MREISKFILKISSHLGCTCERAILEEMAAVCRRSGEYSHWRAWVEEGAGKHVREYLNDTALREESRRELATAHGLQMSAEVSTATWNFAT